MTQNLKRKQLAEEISSKLDNKRNVSIDNIRAVLENDVLLYIPSFPAASILIEEWDRVTRYNIIITSKIINFRKMWYRIHKAGCIGDLMSNKFVKNLVLTLPQVEEFKEQISNSYIFNQNFSCIFDDFEAEMIRHFNTEKNKQANFSNHWLFGKSIFNFFITKTPSTFLGFVRGSYRFVHFYAHRSYLETSFLKTIEESGQMIYFDSNKLDKDFLESIKDKNPLNIFKTIEYLVHTGLFYSSMFKGVVNFESEFVSGKIAALIATLEKTKGFLTLIYVNSPLEQFIIYKILIHISVAIGKESKPLIDIDLIGKMIEETVLQHMVDETFIKQSPPLALESIPSVIHNRVIEETGTVLNIQFLRNIRERKRSELFNIILFDYVPFIGKDYKVFILPLSFRETFKFQLQNDMSIAESFKSKNWYVQAMKETNSNLITTSDDIINSVINLTNNVTGNVMNQTINNITDNVMNQTINNVTGNIMNQTINNITDNGESTKSKYPSTNSDSSEEFPSANDKIENDQVSSSGNSKEIELKFPNAYGDFDFSIKQNTVKKSYNFYLLSGSLDQVRERSKSRGFIISTYMEDRKVVVNANCVLGRATACLNVHHAVNEPVLMPKSSQTRGFLFSMCDGFELCTLTSFKTMINCKTFTSNCFVMISAKKVCLFSFSKERNLMFEFTGDDLENFILISSNRMNIKKKLKRINSQINACDNSNSKTNACDNSNRIPNPQANINTNTCDTCHFSSDRIFEVYDSSLVFSFCMKNRPRIYSCDHSDEIHMKITESLDISEKCHFFTKIEWKRLTLNEFSDLEDRFDIRISIPCFQDLPGNVYDSLTVALSSNRNNEHMDHVNALTSMTRRYHLELFVSALSSYPIQLVACSLVREQCKYSSKQILEYFNNFEFDHYYAMACLISRKARFLLSHINHSDLEFISKQPLSVYCPELDKTLTGRFEPVNLKISYFSKKNLSPGPGQVMIRSVILTPMEFSFEYEVSIDSNRVLRNFDSDKFCKLLIRDENGEDKFIYDSTKNTDQVYEYFRNVLLNGFTLGLRKYFFLVMTTSQLKVHGSWFVTPYEKDGQVIGSDYIKSWIGNFHSIQNIGKYAARIGMALSSTSFARNVNNFVEIEDTVRNEYNFTDGVGICSRALAALICQDLKLDHVPSAFQIRFAGYKGVIAVHPWLDDTSFYSDNPFVTEIINSVKASNFKDGRIQHNNKNISNEIRDLNTEIVMSDENNKTGNYNTKGIPIDNKINQSNIKLPDLILRKSMNKFESSNRSLEIVNIPKSCDFYLNRQIIMMLEGLGVSSQVFIEFQNKYIYDMLVSLKKDYSLFVKNHSLLSSNVSTDVTFYRKLQAPILSRVFEELNAKSNILIPQGRGAMGVVDELGLLEEDQVFCMLKKRSDENMSGLIDYGSYVVPNCYCIVAKNPVMHPGDIRLVKCIDCPALHYLKDLIVFSKKGNRPVFNQCSGSDLDGDIFYLSWAKALIPKATFRPYNYNDTNALIKERVLFSDIVNFFVRSMKFYQLGQIANSYMAIADQYSVFNEKALKLSEIFNKSIDYVKTGNLVAIPDDLIPTEYPDFMERQPSYKSSKALGLLYRRSLFDFSGLNYCECHACTTREIQDFCEWKEFILLGAGVKTRESIYKGPVNDEYNLIYNKYKQDILYLMNKFQQPNEESLFCEKHNPEVRSEILRILDSYTTVLKDKESLRMSAISSCNNFSGLELLCPDSYKLRNNIKKSIVKEGTSTFVFNSKIHLCKNNIKDKIISNKEHNKTVSNELINSKDPYNKIVSNEPINNKDLYNSNSSIDFSNHKQISYQFYNNNFEFNELTVYCNKEKIEEFITSLDWKRKDLFKDFFNLILLCGLFKITEIDSIFDYFISLNKQMTESSVTELLRVAIPKSTDLTFKILCLLPLDLSIHKKCYLLREKAVYSINEEFKPTKICKRACLIISGMLDENDDLEFLRKDKKFVPVLRNKGKCSVDYYKDTLRDFIVNLLYSQENHHFLINLGKSHSLGHNTAKPSNKDIDTNLNLNNSVDKANQMKEIKSQGKSLDSQDNSIPLLKKIDPLIEKTSSFDSTIHSTDLSSHNYGYINPLDAPNDPNLFSERKKVCLRIDEHNNYRGIYEVIFTPGEFYFTNVPITHIKDRISVKFLEQILASKILKNTFDFTFNNTHESLDTQKSNGFLEKIKRLVNTSDREILSFIYDQKRYDIEYQDSKLFRITKNKIILGKSFILNNSERNDLKVEVFRKELIYNETLNLLEESEMFMLKRLFVFESPNYRIQSTHKQFDLISKIKLEKTTTFSNEDGFTMAHSEFYSDFSKGLLSLKNVRKSSYVYKEFSLKTLDSFNFDKIYGKLWRLYNQIL